MFNIGYALHRLRFYFHFARQRLTVTGLQQYYASAKESYAFWSTPSTFKDCSTAVFKDYHAIGIIANEDAETSFMWWVVGDNGEAHGSAQMHADRAEVVKNGCGIDVRNPDTSHLDNLRAILWELNHVEKTALAEILKTTNAYDAAYAFCKYYERAGSANATTKRATRAVFWGQYFKLPANVLQA